MKFKISINSNIIFLFILTITTQIFAQDPFNSPTVLPGADANMSQAVVFGDFNNDGWIDLYLTKGNDVNGSSYQNYLYKNNSGTLTITTITGITDYSLTSGSASWGDYNNDGFLDLYVAAAQPGFNGSAPPNNLFLNDGSGSFVDKTNDAATGSIVTNAEDSRHVGWGDRNNDGFIDMFIDNGFINNFGPGKGQNSFYQNDGDATFTQLTSSSIGNIVSSSNDYKTFGSGFGWADYNNDGFLDIFNTSGGGKLNYLWKNDFSGTGMFIDATPTAMQPTNTSFISVSWGDYDNDGDLDLYACNLEDGSIIHNFLFQNNSTPSTTSFTEMTGIGPIVTDEYHSQSSEWGDIDNDGDLDLFASNKNGSSGNAPATLYRNSGSSGNYNFTKVKDYFYPGSSDPFNGRGIAFADLNNDGFLDLVAARDGQPLLYKNNAGNGNKFTLVKLVGTGTTNTSAIGSRVIVSANIPEQNGITNQLREISGQTGGGGQNSLRTHFGLGTSTKVDTIKAVWLNSTGGAVRDTNLMTDLPTNKFVVFTKGNLNVSSSVIPNQTFMYLSGNTTSAVEFTSNTDADGGTLTVQKFNSDPGGTFDGNSAADPGGNTITPNAVVNDRYWSIAESGLTGNFTTSVYFDASSLPAGLNVDNIVVLKRANSSSDWTPLATSKIGNTVYATGINSFSEFGLGYVNKVLVEVKIFLEGAYDSSIHEMRTDINGNIPTTSPYSEDPRTTTVTPIPSTIVDWVLVQLRTADTGPAVSSRSAFIRNDGRIVADNGTTGYIKMDIADGDYYIVIKHRNHLAVMSANPVSLNASTSTLYDFTN